MNSIDQYYRNQASGLPYFSGPLVQQGHGLGGIFSSIFRAVSPLLRSAAPYAKAAAKTVVSEAARTGADILSDVVHGANVKDATRDRSGQAVDRLIMKGSKKLRKMRRQRNPIKGKRKRSRDIFSS